MRRKRWVQLVAIVAVLAAAVAVAWAAGPGTGATGSDSQGTIPVSGGAGAPADLSSGDFAARSLPADTPPPLRAAGAWPFEELPLVIKGTTFPSPRIAVPFNAPSPADALFTEAVVGPIPPAAVGPAGVGAIGQAPWLLLPPVAGIAIFALDDTGNGGGGGTGGGTRPEEGGGEPPPPAVIPEPSTWLLLFTGLVLVGAHARHRRRRGDAPG